MSVVALCYFYLTFPLLIIRGAAGLEAVGDVSVGEVFEDPLWEGQWLHLVCGDRVPQDGSAQVAQAGHRPGRPPEPHVAVSGSVTREDLVSVS